MRNVGHFNTKRRRNSNVVDHKAQVIINRTLHSPLHVVCRNNKINILLFFLRLAYIYIQNQSKISEVHLFEDISKINNAFV